MDYLAFLFTGKLPSAVRERQLDFHWEHVDEGVMLLQGKNTQQKNTQQQQNLILSAGIHGNETAPIELMAEWLQDLFEGRLQLKVRLLLILGNPEAIRQGRRYLENDLNRMFSGAHQGFALCDESRRAQRLEQLLMTMMTAQTPSQSCWHYDLHTAIRASLLPTFALIPAPAQQATDAHFRQSLDAAELDAVVYHREKAATFSQFTQDYCGAQSVTLELGKAKALGDNDLTDFAAIDRVIRAAISAQQFARRQKSSIRRFEVLQSILKSQDDFQLHLHDQAPNFSCLQHGQVIASETGRRYQVEPKQVWILFPNAQVKKGLRAGLILGELV
ncbi:succinylglutamate desuccinylase [Acinetobacter larvae]|uniref:Succinylglutamate desuccinylase n=2 Tax=Acinetobacter larvae TaxID=1789224 RepID=A0A1B2M3W8_9GAMM|nr:succinylglutamate desuccinylase [Acinetobacter larvae]